MISIIFFQLCKLKSLESNLYYPDNQSNKKKKLQRYKMTIGKKWIEMTKKLPRGHNLGGSTKQKRRKEHKQESDKN